MGENAPPKIASDGKYDQREGITTLRIYQYCIFHHTVIETCFEILKSSEHEKLGHYSSYKSPNFLDCSVVF